MMIHHTSGRPATPAAALTAVLAAGAVLLAACSGSAPQAPATPSGSAQPPTADTSAPPTPGTSEPSEPPEPSDSPAATSTPTPTTDPADEPAITMQSPAPGATLQVPFTMSGTANTFEAALTVDARNAAGEYLCIRHIMATSGTGTRGTWQTRLAFPPPHESGTQPVTLRAYELSARDGSIINVTQRQILLSATRPAVMLATPACGDVVSPGGQVAVTGVATVFEAALTVELRDAGGAVRQSTNLMSAEGGVESAFSGMITLPAALPGGYYDLVAFSFSPKDGSKQNEFPVQILVR